MKKAKLFHTQSILSIFLCLAGVTLTTLNFLQEHPSSLNMGVSIPLTLVGFFQYWNSKKFYLKYDKKQITWHFPTSEEAKSIELSDGNYEVSQDWKGLVFKGENQSFEISLNQFWERDKKRLYHQLKSYYQTP